MSNFVNRMGGFRRLLGAAVVDTVVAAIIGKLGELFVSNSTIRDVGVVLSWLALIVGTAWVLGSRARWQDELAKAAIDKVQEPSSTGASTGPDARALSPLVTMLSGLLAIANGHKRYVEGQTTYNEVGYLMEWSQHNEWRRCVAVVLDAFGERSRALAFTMSPFEPWSSGTIEQLKTKATTGLSSSTAALALIIEELTPKPE